MTRKENKKVKPLPTINYFKYTNGKAGRLVYPPLPVQLQKSLDLCLNSFGEDSDEFINLKEDIVFIEDKWTRMCMGW